MSVLKPVFGARLPNLYKGVHFGQSDASISKSTSSTPMEPMGSVAKTEVSSVVSPLAMSDKQGSLPHLPASIVSLNVQGNYHPDWAEPIAKAGGQPKAGGMAEVEHNIASQMKLVDADWRTMCPLFKGMEGIGFQPTGLSTAVKGPDGNTERYELFWIEKDGRIKYGIHSESLSQMKHIDDTKLLTIKVEDLPKELQKDWQAMNRQPSSTALQAGGTSGATPVISTATSGATEVFQVSPATDKNAAIKLNQEIIKLNQAMAYFVTQLSAENKASAKPWQIVNGPDAVIVNDHMNGQALAELADRYPEFSDKTTTVFFTHNTYGPEYGQLPHKLAAHLGIAVPKCLEKTIDVAHKKKAKEKPVPSKAAKPSENNLLQALWQKLLTFLGLHPGVGASSSVLAVPTSPEKKAAQKTMDLTAPVNSLRLGMGLADLTIVNKRFSQSILGGRFGVDPFFKAYLAEKETQKMTFDMHHAVSPHVSPVHNQALQSDGFEPMPEALHGAILALGKTPGLDSSQIKAQLKQWKATNKLALQKQMGLKPDPDAVLYGMLVRFGDARQKGSLQLAHTLEKFLTEHPKAQFIIPAKAADPKNLEAIEGFIQAIQHNPELKDRVSFQGWIDDQGGHRVRAGCDYLLTVSGYEPYGLSQLEPMMTGTVPIVTGRDGLFATVSDLHVLPTFNHTPKEAKKSAYGQTGYIVDSDMMAYLKAIDDYGPNFGELPSLKPVRKANKALLKTLDRTYQAYQSGTQLQVAINAMRYVNAEHSMPSITTKYYVPLLSHILAQKKSPKLSQTV
ncbi:MAG: hypothetical protein VKK59_01255 [Vampirovibrionales bacterium]|nr:hypothetical protein [Vampirovibrionales bacterium]